jgi:hypothetical protein
MGVSGGSFTVPEHGEAEENVFYRIRLTVIDPSGLTASVFRDISIA